MGILGEFRELVISAINYIAGSVRDVIVETLDIITGEVIDAATDIRQTFKFEDKVLPKRKRKLTQEDKDNIRAAIRKEYLELEPGEMFWGVEWEGEIYTETPK